MVTHVFTALTTSSDATIVAEALTAQIAVHRNALDHRSLFSAAFNRKLVRKIEVLEKIRDGYLDYASELRSSEATQQAHDQALLNGKGT